MATYSLNQLITIFNNFATLPAEKHLQINSFGFGEIWEANGNPKTTGNTPTLWVFPTQSTQLENTIVYSFDVRCWDLVTKGESNENDVLSDTHQILSDFIQFIKHNTVYDINVSGDPTLTPFTEQLADDVTGWQCSIDVEVNSINSDCMIPMGDVEPFPNPLNCEPVTITDGLTVTEVASGGSYTCSGGACDSIDIENSDSTYTENITCAESPFTLPDVTIEVINSLSNVINSQVIPSVQNFQISAGDSNISNSDDTYVVSLPANESLELPDTTYEIYVSGVLNQTLVLPSVSSQTLNIFP